MKVIEFERLEGVGMIRVYNAYRCDTCEKEQTTSEYYLDGSVAPSGWTHTYKRDRPGFVIQQDHCPKCSHKA